MALLDVNLLFYHATSTYAMTTGEYMSVAGSTTGSTGLVINLGVAQDMGIGDGEFVPKIMVSVGSTGFTSSCSSLRVNAQFQGSTDSTTWTTYVESGTMATSSLAANAQILPIDVPMRPQGVALPQYYRLNLAVTGNAASESISSGSLIGGIVIQRGGWEGAGTAGAYPSGFSVI